MASKHKTSGGTLGGFTFGKKPKKKSNRKMRGGERYIDSTSERSYYSDEPARGVRYAECLTDRYARHDAAKLRQINDARGLTAEAAQRKQRSRSISTVSSISLSGSEIEALERLEDNKTTSTALKRLWQNMKHLKEKIQKLEDAISDMEDDNSRQTSKKVKQTKSRLEFPKGKGPGKKSNEEDKNEDIAANTPTNDPPDPMNNRPDAEINDPVDDKSEEIDEVRDTPPEKQIENMNDTFPSNADDISSIVEDIEKASDGDDEDSGIEEEDEDNVEYDEEVPAPIEFELKYQFFHQKDLDELSLFYDDRIEPFIRVRWDHINRGASADDTEAIRQKDKVVPGEIDILQICLESFVFKDLITRFGGISLPRPRPHVVSGPGVIPSRQENYLGRADNTVSFYKPFRWLIQNRDLLEHEMKKYEDDVLRNIDTMEPLLASQKNKDIVSNSEIDGDERDLSSNLGAQIRLLLDFMDKYLAEPLEKHKNARAGNFKTIAFEDLWMLYKPGDIIYCPLRTALATADPPQQPPPVDASGGPFAPFSQTTRYRQGFGRDTPQAYKIVSVVGGRQYAAPNGPGGRMANTYAPLKLICYYLDFSGFMFDVVTDTFTFHPFDIELGITDLEAYPLVYASSADIQGESGMREFLAARGRSFVKVSEASHKLYNGPSWVNSQFQKEEIDTPVIVDFALAYQNFPHWYPAFCAPAIDYYSPPDRHTSAESLEITLFSRTNRTGDWYWTYQSHLVNKTRSTINDTVQSYPVVGTSTSDSSILELIAAMEANGDILLLPGTAYAFALRLRRWVGLDLTLLQDTQYEDGWNDLILPAGHKEMVRAVVENHAAGSRATGGMKKNSAEVDIVRGKGKGCIILLHGEPGVGKTSTAECVAAYSKRPLFPITCGDIGYEADEVERNLQKHFTLAHKWGCVMLLDEADVFLAKRSRDDIKRNGLVSVFLRILEYYPGILFLTTNRVGSFDDAFRSRLHMTLYYPKLNLDQTLQIYEMNIRRVRELNSKREEAGQRIIQVQDKKILKFAKRFFEPLSWNGRQIRNAFQTAIALAEFDVKEDQEGERQAVMGKKQFKIIADASVQFDDYLFNVHGQATEADKARKEQVRWDHEIEERPGRKANLVDSSSESSSDSSSSSSDSSSDSSDSSSDAADSSGGGNEKRRRKKNKKKGKSKDKDKKSKKSESKNKNSRSKKDKHS